jgi:ribosome-associated protein
MKKVTGKTTAKPAAKKTAAKGAGKATPRKTKTEAESEEAIVNKLANEKTAAPKTRKVARSKAPAHKPAETSLELALQVAQGMFERKAENIRILDMRNVRGASADFFVISHAESDKQVEAIANSVEEEVNKQSNEWPRHREGQANLEWVLLDYFDVVAHVFQREKRDFYAVEELWGDALDVAFEGV